METDHHQDMAELENSQQPVSNTIFEPPAQDMAGFEKSQQPAPNSVFEPPVLNDMAASIPAQGLVSDSKQTAEAVEIIQSVLDEVVDVAVIENLFSTYSESFPSLPQVRKSSIVTLACTSCH